MQYPNRQYSGAPYTGGSSGSYHGYSQEPSTYSYGTGYPAGAYGNSQANYYGSTSYLPAHTTHMDQQQPYSAASTGQSNCAQGFAGTSYAAFGDYLSPGVPNSQQNSHHGPTGYPGSQTIPVTSGNHVITGGNEESTLNPRYRKQKHPERFFTPGRVFGILWHENVGVNGTVVTERSHYSKGKFSEPIYSNIRRMVVVKKGDKCSWCLPIHTYSGQGTAKPGVKAEDHAIIYMAGSAPFCGAGEGPMLKHSLEVKPASVDQKLNKMSRLNFGKIYTVEHNVKVMPVGKITEESMPKLLGHARSSIKI